MQPCKCKKGTKAQPGKPYHFHYPDGGMIELPNGTVVEALPLRPGKTRRDRRSSTSRRG